MRILDLSAGSRSIWFNRVYRDTVYVDIREEMKPTVVCDTASLPFMDNVFDLIVFDPPHVTCGPGSVMAKYYSSMEAEEIRHMVWRSSVEAYRVAKSGALLALKWNDHDVKLERVLRLMEGWEALFGQKVAGRSKHRSGTYWVLMRKRESGVEEAQKVFRFLEAVDHD